MVTAQDVIALYNLLLANGLQVWLVGGWGIDALLGEQTRPHKDLDLLLLLDELLRAQALLAGEGFSLKELWSENRWAVDANGAQTATALVLRDAAGRELDLHALCLDAQGNGIPAYEAGEGFVFTREDLSGQGTIAGVVVPCITPAMQRQCHTGYTLPDYQQRDLERLSQLD